MRHPEGADEDVHLPTVLLVEEQQSLPTVDRVKANLGRVAQSLEELLRVGRHAFRCDPIRVAVLAPEHRKEAILPRSLVAIPPSSRRAILRRFASSTIRKASSTTSDRISSIPSPLLLVPLRSRYSIRLPYLKLNCCLLARDDAMCRWASLGQDHIFLFRRETP